LSRHRVMDAIQSQAPDTGPLDLCCGQIVLFCGGVLGLYRLARRGWVYDQTIAAVHVTARDIVDLERSTAHVYIEQGQCSRGRCAAASLERRHELDVT